MRKKLIKQFKKKPYKKIIRKKFYEALSEEMENLRDESFDNSYLKIQTGEKKMDLRIFYEKIDLELIELACLNLLPLTDPMETDFLIIFLEFVGMILLSEYNVDFVVPFFSYKIPTLICEILVQNNFQLERERHY